MVIQKVWIEDDCTACELYASKCPDVFEMGEEKAQVIGGADLGANEDCIREAAEDCPIEVVPFEESKRSRLIFNKSRLQQIRKN